MVYAGTYCVQSVSQYDVSVAEKRQHIVVHQHWEGFEPFLVLRKRRRNNSVIMYFQVLPVFQHVQPGNYWLKEIWLVQCVYTILTFLNGSVCV